jgi:hypothetical protein
MVEVSQAPMEVRAWRRGAETIATEVLDKVHNYVQVAQGLFIYRTHLVEDKAGAQQHGQGKDLEVNISGPFR